MKIIFASKDFLRRTVKDGPLTDTVRIPFTPSGANFFGGGFNALTQLFCKNIGKNFLFHK